MLTLTGPVPMNPVDAPEASGPNHFPAEAIAAARVDARASGTRVVDALEAIVGLAPAEFMRRLAATVRFPGAHHGRPAPAARPAFDVLPFADATQHECLALRDPRAGLLVVFGDPFDAGVARLGRGAHRARISFRTRAPGGHPRLPVAPRGIVARDGFRAGRER